MTEKQKLTEELHIWCRWRRKEHGSSSVVHFDGEADVKLLDLETDEDSEVLKTLIEIHI